MSAGGGGGGGQQESAEARELYRTQANIARGQWDDWVQLGRPIMADLSEQALRGASDARYAERIGQAGADVTQAFAAEREAMGREMAGFGLNPASGRFQGMDRGLRLAEAGAKAGAMTRARRGVDDEVYSRQINAVGLASGQGAQAQQGLATAASGMQGIANTQAQAQANRQQGAGALAGTVITAGAFAF